MAEKRRRRSTSSAERRATNARLAAESETGLLDNPDVEDEPSEIRHMLYFAAVVLGALGLNFIVMLVLAGGQ